MKRIFIAIKLEDNKSFINLKDEIAQIKENLKDEKIKWVDDNLLHLTICFLGEIKEYQISKIKNKISKIIKNYRPFTIKLEGLGVFKSINNPKIIWIGINSRNLINLGEQINRVISENGFRIKNKKFSPHITIGRIKFSNSLLLNKLRNLINQYKKHCFGKFLVSSVNIMESFLKPEGPEYKLVLKLKL